MQPLYFNPLDNTTNFIGTNPLTPTSVPIKTSFYPYFNPSLYQSFTFYTLPVQTFRSSILLGTSYYGNFPSAQLYVWSLGAMTQGNSNTWVSTVWCYSLPMSTRYYFSTFETVYAKYFQIQPVTYSVRFGTQLQPIIASSAGAVNTFNTYRYTITHSFIYYSYLYYTYHDGQLFNEEITGLMSQNRQTYLVGDDTISNPFDQANGTVYIGSSSFVNMMGSNVYTGLIDSTNSIIIYQNEQVSSYYSQSLSYQVNIANLTTALNSVSTSGDGQENGQGKITVTTFSWNWESTPQGWTGSKLTVFKNYLSTQIVNNYLSNNYGGIIITNSSIAVTQVQSLITVQNNDLANSQTFMNNAVTTLQSQVSLAGQIIGTLSSIMQSIISNM